MNDFATAAPAAVFPFDAHGRCIDSLAAFDARRPLYYLLSHGGLWTP